MNIRPLLFAPFIAAILVTIHSVFFLSLIDYIGKGLENGKKIVVLKKFLKIKTKKDKPIEIKYLKRMKRFWYISLGAFFFILVMGIFESNGRKNAETLLLNIKNNSYGKVKVKIQDSDKNIAYLYCGNRNCAGLDLKTKEIVYFPQDGYLYLPSK